MARRNGGNGSMLYLVLGAAALYVLSKPQATAAAATPAAPAPVVFYGGGPAYPGADVYTPNYGDFDYGQSLAQTAIATGATVAENIIGDFGDWLSGLLSPGSPLGVSQPT